MAEQKQGKKFRTVFGGGYNKEDVNEYLESMQAQFDSVEDTLKGTINRQKEELNRARDEEELCGKLLTDLEERDRETEKLRGEAEEARNELSRAEEQIRAAIDEKNEAEMRRAEANAKMEEAEAELVRIQAEIRELTETLSASEAEKASLGEQIGDLQDQLAQLQEKNAENDGKCAAITAERAVAAAERMSAQNECVVLSEKIRQLEEENNTLRQKKADSTVYPENYEELSEKAAAYDKMSAQFGALLMKARADAEDIRTTARADAEKMLTGVNQELAQARERASAVSDQMISGVNGKLNEINSNCCDDILLELEDMTTAVRSAMDTLQRKYAEIGRKLDYAKAEMENAAHSVIGSATAPRILK